MKYPDPMRVCPVSKTCSHVDGYLCDPNTCLSIIVEKLKVWLGAEGKSFFKEIKAKHGQIDAVFMEGRIPHPVHFREGMQVRNFLRGLPECKDWDAHDYDNKWVLLVEEGIK